MDVQVKEQAPGLSAAADLGRKIKQLGIDDIQLFFDPQIKMWCVCQVQKRGGIILPQKYMENGIRPHIMWWCKDGQGKFRAPGNEDLQNIIITRKRAEAIWDKGGEYLADKLDEQDAKKDAAYRVRKHDMAADTAKRIRKAIK